MTDNWPNIITAARIALVPVFVLIMYTGEAGSGDPATAVGSWVALGVFAVAALSDSLDGYLARRWERITRVGQILDPLADKLLVGAALVALVDLRAFPLWAAIVIVLREVAVSLLRSLALRRGRVLPANSIGKAKTALQIPTVMLWLLPRAGLLAVVQDVLLVITVFVTLFSGFVYFARAGQLLARDPATPHPAQRK